jgi:predicted flap endonuclease-1-like 5' DNA nuclease
MNEFLQEYLLVFLVALAIGAIIGFLVFRPRQKVRLTDSAPVRPHMTTAKRNEGNGIGDEVAAATSDVAGQIISAPIHDNLPGASGPPDNLERLKGVGPKFAQLLASQGIVRFDQIARLSPGEVERLDEGLGAFRGRIARDRIVEQADYLARGDEDGFEPRFGKLYSLFRLSGIAASPRPTRPPNPGYAVGGRVRVRAGAVSLLNSNERL